MNEERTARFSASNISRLLSNGRGGGISATAQSYILELALASIGIKEDIQTKEMLHGINNQINAFDKVVRPLYPNAVWFDQYLPINEWCGASPDLLIDGNPMDVKCPFYVDTYLDQINSVPTKYYQQVQMQAMATKAEKCYLCFYLTAPEVWGSEEWDEYPIELEKRYKIFEFAKDEALHDMILAKVEESEPKKKFMIDLLNNALIMDFEQFFYLQFDGYAFRKLKTCSNILNLEQIIRVNNEFYYQSKNGRI